MGTPTKRKAETQEAAKKTKKQKVDIPEYHLTPSRRDGDGEIVWPAPKAQITRAREIIQACAAAKKSTLILPDKDADGLSSGAILFYTLQALGLPPDLISVHFPPKGSNVHHEDTRDVISSISPSYIFVLDQGSRKSEPLSKAAHTCLVIDHHFAEQGGFPAGAEYVTAHDCPPVATSSLLTYNICLPLHPDLEDKVSWLAALGTHGDLGNTLKWEPPFPDMKATFKKYSKKSINDAVGLINAPRRSAAYNVSAAWNALMSVDSPQPLLANEDLRDAQFEVKQETERWAHVPPKFSRDAKIAVLTIKSAAQVHPVIATRWAGFLKSDKLEVVMCANEGYLPGKVNFSCRVAKQARARQGEHKVDIIKILEDIVADDQDLRARLGESFARGHKEASGGIANAREWEDFKKSMGVGENSRKKSEAPIKENKKPANTLENYFIKAS